MEKVGEGEGGQGVVKVCGRFVGVAKGTVG